MLTDQFSNGKFALLMVFICIYSLKFYTFEGVVRQPLEFVSADRAPVAVEAVYHGHIFFVQIKIEHVQIQFDTFRIGRFGNRDGAQLYQISQNDLRRRFVVFLSDGDEFGVVQLQDWIAGLGPRSCRRPKGTVRRDVDAAIRTKLDQLFLIQIRSDFDLKKIT
jgi:hypothetical protein